MRRCPMCGKKMELKEKSFKHDLYNSKQIVEYFECVCGVVMEKSRKVSNLK